jgi:hypothetical protein
LSKFIEDVISFCLFSINATHNMMSNYQQLYLGRIEDFGYGQLEFMGCSDTEIEELSAAAGFKLPLAYTDFMRLLGRNSGGFLQDYSFLYPKVIELNRYCQSNYPSYLLDYQPCFVFISRMGDEHLFLKSNQGDDPPVYGWRSDEDRPKLKVMSFSEFIEVIIRYKKS